MTGDLELWLRRHSATCPHRRVHAHYDWTDEGHRIWRCLDCGIESSERLGSPRQPAVMVSISTPQRPSRLWGR